MAHEPERGCWQMEEQYVVGVKTKLVEFVPSPGQLINKAPILEHHIIQRHVRIFFENFPRGIIQPAAY
jgi:hypothetical protein